MTQATDKLLREQQAGFRKHRSCTDQITTLRIILEQSIEWNSSLCVNFVDFEKAFDSIDREVLWSIMRHYGIPEKIVNIIKNTYQGATCRVVHGGQLSEPFQVKTGGRQGCLLTPFLFLLVVDCVMRRVTEGRRTGIQWTLHEQLEDLDFADDLALLSHSHQQMQEKTSRLEEVAAVTGLIINRDKTKMMRLRNKTTQPIKLSSGTVEEVESFTYLGSVVSIGGGTEEDIKARLGKARIAFRMLDNIWKSKVISRHTKIRLFNSNVKTVLLYGSETWRVTKALSKRVQIFLNRSLRRILNIKWQDKITNEEVWAATNQQPIETTIRGRKWRWIEHTLRRDGHSITKQALRWVPQGKRNRGRPKNTWRRSVDGEMKAAGFSWNQLERTAQDRVRWRNVVTGLCSTGD